MNGINPGAMNPMVNGTNGVQQRTNENMEDMKIRLNTYIYDYFLRNEQYGLARALKDSSFPVNTASGNKRKASSDDGEDTKDEMNSKKPADLPYPDGVPNGSSDNSFLLDWFQIFWEMFFAPRKDGGGMKPGVSAVAYIEHQKAQQNMRQNGIPNGMMPGYPGMMRAGQPAMNLGARNMPQHPNMRAMNSQQQQHQMMMAQRQQQQMMQNQQSQIGREGGEVDMTDPNMLNQGQFNNFPGQNQQNQKKNMEVYSQNLANAHRQNMPQAINGQTLIQQQGSEEFYNTNMMARQMQGQMAPVPQPPPGGQSGQGGQNNHALQDYQMQLMLLEQQNKKRLLMARQEQDQVRPGEPPMGGQAGFAPNMSPQGSRSGPSPNPSEQMKRATPKLGQAGLPGGPNSPMPDSNMVHARGSPGAMNFNGMDMMQQGMKGPDGMPMGPGMRPPSSHPGFQGGPANNAQLEAMRAAAQQGGRMPNGGAWPQGPGGQAPGMPQGAQGPGQHMGTPQQRNAAMPPPQNVPLNGANGRPASPAQSAAAGTPQQSNKPPPAKKGKAAKETKKAPQKKGAAAATPSADVEVPQTPTPATPITPNHPNSFKDGKGGSATTTQANPNVAAPAVQVPQQQDVNMLNHFDGVMEGLENHGSLNLQFGGMDTGDVLEQFDFDAFLDTGEGDLGFDMATGYGNFDGLEAGTGDA